MLMWLHRNAFYFSVPPMILEQYTSNDMVVREGSNVTLNCKAKGYPEPYIMWRREDGSEMSIGGENGRIHYFSMGGKHNPLSIILMQSYLKREFLLL